MVKEVLDEREFELVNIVGADLGSNQRDLSRHMDLSLGMVNMLIRRLISKGYIRINQLNKRKVQYILTPKGFAEKMRKSVKYTLKTINSIGSIKSRLKNVLSELVDQGQREFIIFGMSDFSILVELVLRELQVKNYNIAHVEQLPAERDGGVLLICQEGYEEQKIDNSINIIEELAKDYTYESIAGDN